MAAQSASPIATFSIVATDLAIGDVGVAVASKFLAAGAVVPWAAAGAGAVATQAFANASYGPEGLSMMRAGASAAETMRRLIADDPDRDRRQVGLVDARGGAAAHTGKDCFAWAGHIVGERFACQGNILASEETVNAMAASFRSSQGALVERLLAALTAGEAAGGDRRGRQSAALSSRGNAAAISASTTCWSTSGSTTTPIRLPSSGASSTCRTSISDRARR